MVAERGPGERKSSARVSPSKHGAAVEARARRLLLGTEERLMTRASGTALVLTDVINAFDFPNCGPLVRAAKAAAPAIEALMQRARAERLPVIYVNDNFGQWTSDFKSTVAECAKPDRPGHAVTQRLRPLAGDYFVLKPQHSGFYGTPLDLLLGHLQVHTLVLMGFAANICVLFTANDAHMRGYHVVVPRDCVASNTKALTQGALGHVRTALGGSTPPGRAVDFDAFRGRRKKPRGQTF
jgi:nicotinamidase-related amidase